MPITQVQGTHTPPATSVSVTDFVDLQNNFEPSTEIFATSEETLPPIPLPDISAKKYANGPVPSWQDESVNDQTDWQVGNGEDRGTLGQ